MLIIPSSRLVFGTKKNLGHFLDVADSAQFGTRFTAQANARVVTLQQLWTRLIALGTIARFAAQALAAAVVSTQNFVDRPFSSLNKTTRKMEENRQTIRYSTYKDWVALSCRCLLCLKTISYFF